MVKVREDLTGKIFGRLIVLEQAEDYIRPDGRHEAQWLCECNCPKHTKKIISGNSLKSGLTQSCGCLQSEYARQSRKDSHKVNKYSSKLTDEYGDYYIGLTTNTGKEFYIDAEDFDKVKDYCWSESIDHNKGYSWLIAWDENISKTIKMHQLIFGKYCDHNDRNTLNNRKYNLRPSTFSENMQNRGLFKNNKSGITGVFWRPKEQMWQVYININNKKIHLGWCSSKEEAIKIRLNAEYKYYGEFAPQKYLFEQYDIPTHQNSLDKELNNE